MIQTKYKIYNWICLSLIVLLFCGFQSTFWFHLTAGSPAPQLWLVVFLYLGLYRSYTTAMLGSYALTLIVNAYTATPIGIIWSLVFVLLTPASYIKSRFFWPSLRYFTIATFVFSFSYEVFIILSSYFIENNPTSISIINRISEIVLTTSFSIPIYFILTFVDRVSLPEIGDPNEGLRL